MNINIAIPCSDTASAHIPEKLEKIIIGAVGLALRDVSVALNLKINIPDDLDPVTFDVLPDPPDDCLIDPWEADEYTDPWEPWPQFYAPDRGEDNDMI